MSKIVSINSWPDSQLCMDCDNGEFIQSEIFDHSDYLCFVACLESNGLICPKRTINGVIETEIKSAIPQGGKKCLIE